MTPEIQHPLLSVQELKTYFELEEGIVRAVDGVSFDVHRGQTLAIVGESGCGKSMTARSILQLVDPPGRIVDGKVLLNRSPNPAIVDMIDLAAVDCPARELQKIRGERIALVFQEPMAAFSPVYTVGNQVVEPLRLRRLLSGEDARARVIDMFRKVGIADPERRFGQYPHELSGGLLQRAMIAMALICQPSVLIADEPTTALDVTTQAQILRLLRDLQRDNQMGIILITHDPGVVAQIADQVLVMYLGRQVEYGPVDAIFHDPKHPYTRALLQSVPGAHADCTKPLPVIDGRIPHPLRRPGGCPFRDRCNEPLANECGLTEPRPIPVAAGHYVSCLCYEQTEVMRCQQ